MKKITFLMMIVFLSSFFFNAFSQEMKDVCPFAPTSTPIVADNGDLLWDELFSFNVTFDGEQGVAFADDAFWTAKWQTDGMIRKYDKTTMLKNDSFLLTPTVVGIRDFAYDGTYLYGGNDTSALYKIDLTAHTSTSVTLTGATIRHCTYDPTAYSNAGGFWAGAWANLKLYPKAGGAATVTAPAPTYCYGSAFDGQTTGGPYLWLFCQTATGTPAGSALVDLVQYNIASNTYTGTVHNCSNVSGVVNDLSAKAGGCESTYDTYAPGKLVIIGNVQQTPNRVFGLELVDWGGVGIKENQKNENLAVWPSPAMVNSTINMISTSNITNVKVYNTIGQIVYNENMNKHEVNISTNNFAAGTYIINVIKDDGMVTKKIVVK